MIQHLFRCHQQEYERYRAHPDSHPRYHAEWLAFVDTRTKSIVELGSDPSEYNFYSEWQNVWSTRLQELEVEEWNKKKEDSLKLSTQQAKSNKLKPSSLNCKPGLWTPSATASESSLEMKCSEAVKKWKLQDKVTADDETLKKYPCKQSRSRSPRSPKNFTVSPHRSSGSSLRYRSRSPCLRKSRSRRYSSPQSPLRRKYNSPLKRKSPNPLGRKLKILSKRKSRSPTKRKSTTPLRSHSRSRSSSSVENLSSNRSHSGSTERMISKFLQDYIYSGHSSSRSESRGHSGSRTPSMDTLDHEEHSSSKMSKSKSKERSAIKKSRTESKSRLINSECSASKNDCSPLESTSRSKSKRRHKSKSRHKPKRSRSSSIDSFKPTESCKSSQSNSRSSSLGISKSRKSSKSRSRSRESSNSREHHKLKHSRSKSRERSASKMGCSPLESRSRSKKRHSKKLHKHSKSRSSSKRHHKSKSRHTAKRSRSRSSSIDSSESRKRSNSRSRSRESYSRSRSETRHSKKSKKHSKSRPKKKRCHKSKLRHKPKCSNSRAGSIDSSESIKHHKSKRSNSRSSRPTLGSTKSRKRSNSRSSRERSASKKSCSPLESRTRSNKHNSKKVHKRSISRSSSERRHKSKSSHTLKYSSSRASSIQSSESRKHSNSRSRSRETSDSRKPRKLARSRSRSKEISESRNHHQFSLSVSINGEHTDSVMHIEQKCSNLHSTENSIQTSITSCSSNDKPEISISKGKHVTNELGKDIESSIQSSVITDADIDTELEAKSKEEASCTSNKKREKIKIVIPKPKLCPRKHSLFNEAEDKIKGHETTSDLPEDNESLGVKEKHIDDPFLKEVDYAEGKDMNLSKLTSKSEKKTSEKKKEINVNGHHMDSSTTSTALQITEQKLISKSQRVFNLGDSQGVAEDLQLMLQDTMKDQLPQRPDKENESTKATNNFDYNKFKAQGKYPQSRKEVNKSSKATDNKCQTEGPNPRSCALENKARKATDVSENNRLKAEGPYPRIYNKCQTEGPNPRSCALENKVRKATDVSENNRLKAEGPYPRIYNKCQTEGPNPRSCALENKARKATDVSENNRLKAEGPYPRIYNKCQTEGPNPRSCALENKARKATDVSENNRLKAEGPYPRINNKYQTEGPYPRSCEKEKARKATNVSENNNLRAEGPYPRICNKGNKSIKPTKNVEDALKTKGELQTKEHSTDDRLSRSDHCKSSQSRIVAGEKERSSRSESVTVPSCSKNLRFSRNKEINLHDRENKEKQCERKQTRVHLENRLSVKKLSAFRKQDELERNELIARCNRSLQNAYLASKSAPIVSGVSQASAKLDSTKQSKSLPTSVSRKDSVESQKTSLSSSHSSVNSKTTKCLKKNLQKKSGIVKDSHIKDTLTSENTCAGDFVPFEESSSDASSIVINLISTDEEGKASTNVLSELEETGEDFVICDGDRKENCDDRGSDRDPNSHIKVLKFYEKRKLEPKTDSSTDDSTSSTTSSSDGSSDTDSDDKKWVQARVKGLLQQKMKENTRPTASSNFRRRQVPLHIIEVNSSSEMESDEDIDALMFNQDLNKHLGGHSKKKAQRNLYDPAIYRSLQAKNEKILSTLRLLCDFSGNLGNLKPKLTQLSYTAQEMASRDLDVGDLFDSNVTSRVLREAGCYIKERIDVCGSSTVKRAIYTDLVERIGKILKK